MIPVTFTRKEEIKFWSLGRKCTCSRIYGKKISHRHLAQHFTNCIASDQNTYIQDKNHTHPQDKNHTHPHFWASDFATQLPRLLNVWFYIMPSSWRVGKFYHLNFLKFKTFFNIKSVTDLNVFSASASFEGCEIFTVIYSQSRLGQLFYCDQ